MKRIAGYTSLQRRVDGGSMSNFFNCRKTRAVGKRAGDIQTASHLFRRLPLSVYMFSVQEWLLFFSASQFLALSMWLQIPASFHPAVKAIRSVFPAPPRGSTMKVTEWRSHSGRVVEWMQQKKHQYTFQIIYIYIYILCNIYAHINPKRQF